MIRTHPRTDNLCLQHCSVPQFCTDFFKNWVLYAEFEKKTIAVEFLKIGLELFKIFLFLCVKNDFFTDSHENSHAVGTRFHYFPVIVDQSNLVSSLLTSFPRGVFLNIPEKSNPP